MKERMTSAVMAGVTLANLACTGPVERPDITGRHMAEAAESGFSSDPSRVRVDPQQLLAPYAELPDAVRRTQGAAVVVLGKTLWPGSSTKLFEGVGSGTIVDIPGMRGSAPARVALTAAHMVKGKPGACGKNEIELDLDGDNGVRARTVSVAHQSSAPPQPLRQPGPYASYDGLDAAVLLPQKGTQLIPSQPTPRLQEEVTVHPGQVLFAVNYMPTANGMHRTPYANGERGSPAIYAHIVIGQTATHIVSIAGVKSYGKIYDPTQRGGASGGGIVTDTAAYAGVVNGSFDKAVYTEEQIEQQWPVDVPPGTYTLKLTRKIPVRTAQKLLKDARSGPNCEDPLDPKFANADSK